LSFEHQQVIFVLKALARRIDSFEFWFAHANFENLTFFCLKDEIKQNFMVTKYENFNMKWNEQDYDATLYVKLLITGDFTFIYTLLKI